MSEFGATTSTSLVGFDTEWAGLDQVGWAYWAWKYYDDPTGSSAEGLVQPDGNYIADRDGPVADVPPGGGRRPQFDPVQPLHRRPSTWCTRPALAAHGVTSIVVPASQHYPNGWCAAVKGGRITSAARRDPSHRPDHRSPGAGLRLGDGGGCPSG